MTTPLEIRERHKHHLVSLLKIKKANKTVVIGLDEELISAVSVMEQEDVAYVEKIVGVKAL